MQFSSQCRILKRIAVGSMFALSLAFGIVVVWAAPNRLSFQGVCPPRGVKLSPPWSVSRVIPKESFIYNSPHFVAPLSHFGVRSSKSQLSYAGNAFVSLRDCGKLQRSSYASPCEIMARMRSATKRGSGFNDVIKKRSGLLIGYREFWPPNRKFIGICDGVNFDTGRAAPLSFCRVWMPSNSASRGLYVVVPGEAFDAIPRLISDASQFLDKRYESCAILPEGMK